MRLGTLLRLGKPAIPGEGRYVVSIRTAGLGDCLICLGAAWVFARNTGRTLVADWRHSPYSSERERNLFPLCFETTPTLAGVPFIGDDRVADPDLPSPRHPPYWDDDALRAGRYERPREAVYADRDAAVDLIRSSGDVSAPTVVFDACVNEGLTSIVDSRAFLGALRPTGDVAAMLAEARRKHLDNGPVIGLHIRHGNGAKKGLEYYWPSFPATIDRCARAVSVARERVGGDAAVLVCTDSAEVEAAARERIPGVLSRAKIFRRPGEGELHRWREGHRVRDDALVEMLLLAGTSALIRYPPASFFTFYAAVMGHWTGTRARTVADLERPHDLDDELSPAILV